MGSTHDVHVAISLKERRHALDTVLKSSTFARNPRLGKLLEYLCSQAFAGKSASLKEYTIATDVFARPSDFDQSTDAIVRVEMHRLRKKLKDFYATEGMGEPIEIVFQSGHYAPEFVERRVDLPEWKENPSSEPNTEPRPLPLWRRHSWVALIAAGSVALVAVIAWLVLSSTKPNTTTAAKQSPETASISPSTLIPPPSGAIRILSGAHRSQLRDREGNAWGPDAFFEGGTALEIAARPIYRTRNPFLFYSARAGDFAYKVPLKPGVYELHLYFADTSFSPGISMEGGENTRYFNVDLNGSRLLRDLDIIADAGPNTAYERVFKDVQPEKDGYLHLNFIRNVGMPLLNAIEILPGTPHQMRPIRISTQDSGFTDKSGITWEPDNYFLNGRSIAKYGIVTGPVDSQIYERERYGNFSYAIPAAPGKYRLTLHFGETYFGPGEQGAGGIGSRIFDVYCNGTVLLIGLDVFKEAGSRHQLIETFHNIQPNAQGNVLISFVPRKNYAFISAIELIDESDQ
jgi:hypothetical protein